jgi:hypothetical protein
MMCLSKTIIRRHRRHLSGEHKPVRARLYGFHDRSQPHRPRRRGPDPGRGPRGRSGLRDRRPRAASRSGLAVSARPTPSWAWLRPWHWGQLVSTTSRSSAPIRRRKSSRGFAVPAPQTAGSFLKRFTLGHVRQFDKALRAVHLRAFKLLGVSTDVFTLDFDSTYIRSYSSRREGADPTWTKRYTLHPLLCFVAEFRTCLHAKLWRGKAASSRDILSFVVECLRRIPEGVGVRARFDSGFYYLSCSPTSKTEVSATCVACPSCPV